MTPDEKARSWVSVHSCWNDQEAEIILSVLREHGIEARANSAVPHSILPIMADGLGKVDILVETPQDEEARAILDTYE